jgi:hypothetical protein
MMKHRMREIASILWPKVKLLLTIQLIGTTFSMLCLLCSGCATGYLGDRCRDGADIFTATAGLGGGAKIRTGPINLAVPVCLSQNERGLRNGTFITKKNDSGEFWALLFGLDNFMEGKNRNKSCVVATLGPEGPTIQGSPVLYTQLEVLIGLGGTIRLGFNPGELLDFILGWTTIDIYGDDLEANKQREEESNKVQEDTR